MMWPAVCHGRRRSSPGCDFSSLAEVSFVEAIGRCSPLEIDESTLCTDEGNLLVADIMGRQEQAASNATHSRRNQGKDRHHV